MFGGKASFVPLSKASMRGEDVVVPYDKALVKDAPQIQADQDLTSVEEDRLYQHYSLTEPAPARKNDGQQATQGRDTSGPRKRPTSSARSRCC